MYTSKTHRFAPIPSQEALDRSFKTYQAAMAERYRKERRDALLDSLLSGAIGCIAGMITFVGILYIILGMGWV